MHRQLPLVAALAATSAPLAHAGKCCYDFSRLERGAASAAHVAVPIEIGEGQGIGLRYAHQPASCRRRPR